MPAIYSKEDLERRRAEALRRGEQARLEGEEARRQAVEAMKKMNANPGYLDAQMDAARWLGFTDPPEPVRSEPLVTVQTEPLVSRLSALPPAPAAGAMPPSVSRPEPRAESSGWIRGAMRPEPKPEPLDPDIPAWRLPVLTGTPRAVGEPRTMMRTVPLAQRLREQAEPAPAASPVPFDPDALPWSVPNGDRVPQIGEPAMTMQGKPITKIMGDPTDPRLLPVERRPQEGREFERPSPTMRGRVPVFPPAEQTPDAGYYGAFWSGFASDEGEKERGLATFIDPEAPPFERMASLNGTIYMAGKDGRLYYALPHTLEGVVAGIGPAIPKIVSAAARGLTLPLASNLATLPAAVILTAIAGGGTEALRQAIGDWMKPEVASPGMNYGAIRQAIMDAIIVGTLLRPNTKPSPAPAPQPPSPPEARAPELMLLPANPAKPKPLPPQCC